MFLSSTEAMEDNIGYNPDMKILLVEDDDKIGSFVEKGLHEAGYSVDRIKDGTTGFDFAATYDYAAAIVDIMLPGMDGITLIQKLRSWGAKTPILILSSKTNVNDRVRGLQSGADDYLTKPFAFSELVARVQALIRRSCSIEDASILEVSGLRVDLTRRKVMRDQTLIEIQPGEFELLVYLMKNAGRVVSKTMIMENVWDFNFDPQTNVVESRICRLREKIDRPFQDNFIQTIRGFGYKLERDDPLHS